MIRHLAGIVTLLYGLTSIAGGTLGYVRADSLPSLLAGTVCGLLLLLCGVGIFKGPRLSFLSLLGSLLVSLALVGRFVYSSKSQWDKLGAYLETTLGQTAAVMIGGGLVVILLCLAALYFRRR